MKKEFLSLTDDLTPSQFQDLIYWLWINRYRISIPAIKEWRKFRGLEIK